MLIILRMFVQIGARLDQKLDRLLLTLARRAHNGRAATLAQMLNVRARTQQCLNTN